MRAIWQKLGGAHSVVSVIFKVISTSIPDLVSQYSIPKRYYDKTKAY